MPDLKNVESIYLVLGFVVPGMIITYVRAQFSTGRVRTLSENVLAYIVLTVLYYGVAAPVVEYVLTFREPGRPKIFAWLGLIVVLPAVVGLGLGILGQNEIFRKLLQFCKINPIHETPSAWDYVFAKIRGERFVMVTLADGSTVAGIFGSRSFASSDPAERDLLIQEIYDETGGSWSKRADQTAILIPAKEIKHVQFWT